jgi:hypothetical protein
LLGGGLCLAGIAGEKMDSRQAVEGVTRKSTLTLLEPGL